MIVAPSLMFVNNRTPFDLHIHQENTVSSRSDTCLCAGPAV